MLADLAQGYLSALQSLHHPNSFSILEIYDGSELIPPRTPCDDQQISALLSNECVSCTVYYCMRLL